MVVRLIYDPRLGAWRLEHREGGADEDRRLEIVWSVDAERFRRELALVPVGVGADVTVGVSIPRDLLAVVFEGA